jgi:hypothetical protein
MEGMTNRLLIQYPSKFPIFVQTAPFLHPEGVTQNPREEVLNVFYSDLHQKHMSIFPAKLAVSSRDMSDIFFMLYSEAGFGSRVGSSVG